MEQTEDWVERRQFNKLISIQLMAIFIRLWSESMEYGMMNDCVSDSTSWHISNRCLCVSPIDPVCNDETDMTGDETRIYNYYWVGVRSCNLNRKICGIEYVQSIIANLSAVPLWQ